DPKRIDRANGPGDFSVLLWSMGIAAAIWASLVLIGFMYAHVHDGTPADPEVAANARNRKNAG
ncbi:MAG: hypothetical protein VYD64_00080, partial [Pseudomonadota bacterium]|nr:hypothetical protein [Pseudomonadota bacterium]